MYESDVDETSLQGQPPETSKISEEVRPLVIYG